MVLIRMVVVSITSGIVAQVFLPLEMYMMVVTTDSTFHSLPIMYSLRKKCATCQKKCSICIVPKVKKSVLFVKKTKKSQKKLAYIVLFV